jgi:hypothetical protein
MMHSSQQNSTTRDLDGTMDNYGHEMDYPPSCPNDRCAIRRLTNLLQLILCIEGESIYQFNAE